MVRRKSSRVNVMVWSSKRMRFVGKPLPDDGLTIRYRVGEREWSEIEVSLEDDHLKIHAVHGERLAIHPIVSNSIEVTIKERR